MSVMLAEKACDLDRARRELAETGLTRIEGALTPAETEKIRARLLEAAEEDRRAGHAYVYDAGEANQRVWALINRGQCFIDLVEAPFAVDLVRHLLGERFLLSNFSANITGPGGGRMPLHADQGYVEPPWPDFPLAANVIWMLSDFTEENGATVYVPGSHRKGHGPTTAGDGEVVMRPEDHGWPTARITGKAGTAVVMDGRVWHQTGENHSHGERRCGAFAYYVKPWIRTQENWWRSAEPHVLKNADPLLKEMLGFNHYHSLGIVRGMPLDEPRF